MRRRLRTSLAFLAAFIATDAFAAAETCEFPTGETLWSSVTQDFDTTGECAAADENGDDSFVCGDGDRVRITGNIAGTTGRFRRTGTCHVSVDPGVTVRFGGDSDFLDTGTSRLVGTELATSRIQSITRSSANVMHVTLEEDFAGIVDPATDFVVIWDEDPADLDETLNGKVVQVGPGRPASGTHLPSFGKWKWYDISAAAGGALMLHPDPFTLAVASGGYGMRYDGGTYRGNRGAGLTTATALVSITPSLYEHTSTLVVPDSDDRLIAIRGDLSDQYVEITTGPCAGNMAKILDSIDNGAGANADIVVAGNLTTLPIATGGHLDCGATPEIVIHYGERPGQVVKIVRPVTWDGYDGAGTTTGDLTGTLWLGNGNVEVQWARFVRLGTRDRGNDFEPDIYRHCGFCLAMQDATAQLHGYMRNFELAYMSTGATDTGGINPTSLASGLLNGQLRFAGVIADFSDFPFERGYIHDQAVFDTNSGVHGLYVDTAAGVDFRRMRVERLADDLYGDLMTTIGGTVAPSVSLRHFIGMGQAPRPGTSAQGFEPSVPAYGVGVGQETVRLANASHYADVFVTGGADNSCNVNGIQSGHRVVCAGGTASGAIGWGAMHFTSLANAGCMGADVPVDCCDGPGIGTCTMPSGLLDDHPSVLEDAFLATLGPGAEYLRLRAATTLENSIALVSSPSNGHVLTAGMDGAFVYGMSATSAFGTYTVAGGDSYAVSTLALISSAILSDSLGSLSLYLPAFARLSHLQMNRVYLGVGDIAGDNGVLTGANDVAGFPVTFTIDGLNLAATTPDANSVGTGEQSVAAASTFENICAESIGARTANEALGPTPDDTALHVEDVGPGPAERAVLADFLAPAQGGDPCSSLRPNRLGIQNVGVEWPLLGDFAVAQFDRWSSHPTGIVRVRVGDTPACDDGLDDDGDGAIDYPADLGCRGPTSVIENPECQDGLDNDRDGKIDFDGGASANGGVSSGPPDSAQCKDSWSRTEASHCGLGAELALVMPFLLLAARRTTNGAFE